jgi:hypothetical protein
MGNLGMEMRALFSTLRELQHLQLIRQDLFFSTMVGCKGVGRFADDVQEHLPTTGSARQARFTVRNRRAFAKQWSKTNARKGVDGTNVASASIKHFRLAVTSAGWYDTYADPATVENTQFGKRKAGCPHDGHAGATRRRTVGWGGATIHHYEADPHKSNRVKRPKRR